MDLMYLFAAATVAAAVAWFVAVRADAGRTVTDWLTLATMLSAVATVATRVWFA